MILPTQLLGGWWSLAYTSTIRLEGSTKDVLITGTPDKYVSLAV